MVETTQHSAWRRLNALIRFENYQSINFRLPPPPPIRLSTPSFPDPAKNHKRAFKKPRAVLLPRLSRTENLQSISDLLENLKTSVRVKVERRSTSSMRNRFRPPLLGFVDGDKIPYSLRGSRLRN